MGEIKWQVIYYADSGNTVSFNEIFDTFRYIQNMWAKKIE